MYRQINRPRATVLETAHATARASSEALYGEQVEVLEQRGALSHVRLRRDDYTGWLHSECLMEPVVITHRVVVRATLLFTRASIKSPVACALPFGAELALQDSGNEALLTTQDNRYVWRDHVRLRPAHLGQAPIDLAERHFAAAPYLWGGRTPEGCDCSGLVQSVVMATGATLPRDSADQEGSLHGRIEFADRRRGDLVFWAGHVGLLASADSLFHATAHSMTTLAEPLVDVIDRAGPPRAIKRLVSGR